MWVFLKMKSESVGIVHFVKAGNGNSTLIVSMYTNEWNSTYINMFWTDTHIGTVLKKWSVIRLKNDLYKQIKKYYCNWDWETCIN